MSSTTNTYSLSSSKNNSYSSSGAPSHQPVPNRAVLQRSLTLTKPNHGRFMKIFKHFWTCVKPRITDDSSSRQTAAKEEKQGGSTKRRSTTALQRVPSSPSSAMSQDVRDECLKEAILYCNKSGLTSK